MHTQPLSENNRKAVASLVRRKGRDQQGEFLIEGLRSVESAIAGRASITQILVVPRWLEDRRVSALLEKAGAPVVVMNEKQSKSISDVENGQGILAVAKKKPDAVSDLKAMHSLVIMDGVQDPGNVGAIIRTASWFGVQGILCGPGTADIYHPKTVRATMGGLWDVRCVRTDDIQASIQQLKENGFTVYGTYLEGHPLHEWKPTGKIALVIGSEAGGISGLVTGMVDERITIADQRTGTATESLNAAISASICIYHWRSQ